MSDFTKNWIKHKNIYSILTKYEHGEILNQYEKSILLRFRMRFCDAHPEHKLALSKARKQAYEELKYNQL